jgi:hypothetical protein
MSTETETIRLGRTGEAPLAITGTRLREADGRHWGGRERNRWYELSIWRLDDGRLCATAGLCTQWQGESSVEYAAVCRDAAGVRRFFARWNPTRGGIGFPSGEAYVERQAALVAELRRQYDSLVSELLDCEQFAESPAGGGLVS